VTRPQTAVERALTASAKAFGSTWMPDRMTEAPGRLELLGNHVDYSGGKVIAAAIDRTVAVASSFSNRSGSIEVIFGDLDDDEPQLLDTLELEDWRNAYSPPEPLDYVRGAIAALHLRGFLDLHAGLQLAIAGDVPIGLGLSSSAALCVALSMVLSKTKLDDRDLVLIAQEAEHRAGTPCGTMDQSASVAGGFILFDSSTVTFEQLNPSLDELAFAVADSGVSRSLGTSSYPTRVKESQEGLAIAMEVLGRDLRNLAELAPSDLSRLSSVREDRLPPVILRRIRHIVTENERVREGYAALRDDDWIRFGVLMTASGRSSATDYEISHPRVEELVAQALEVEGVLGARMMGGGEGGTALILVKKSHIERLEDKLARGYFAAHGVPLGVHVFETSIGARQHDPV
jgi:galactokinase